ncbi:protoporphyrinogen oxidase, putative [Plasmodium ovale]|uniref:Protoporphyrinogen oxidase, putative n=1 Tax=Plasmodium ovale TaxID=36330 RepID=A0A1D3TG37_PLAOA|nr:protoporphyrinogen oxidase, putative [Plasmodium ovale]
MHEKEKEDIYDVVIVGGGLFGCCLYYYLKKEKPQLKIIIIEKDEMLGGCIKTEKFRKDNKTYVYELGANIFKLSDESYDLIIDLQLCHHIRMLDHKLRRYICYKSNLYPINLNIVGYIFFPLINFTNKVKFLFKLLFNTYKNLNLYDHDISIEDYMKENFDMQHYDFLLVPLIYGSCAGRGNISALSFFSRNLKLVRNNTNTMRIWRERLERCEQREQQREHRQDRETICNATHGGGIALGNRDEMTYQEYNFFYKNNEKMSLLRCVYRVLDKYASMTYAEGGKIHTKNRADRKEVIPSYGPYETCGTYANKYLSVVKKMYQLIKYVSNTYVPLVYSQMVANWKAYAQGEDEKRKKKKYLGKTISLKYGLHEIIHRLKRYIAQKDVYTNGEVNLLEKEKEGNIWVCNVKTEEGHPGQTKEIKNIKIYSKAVVLTVNSKVCSHIMRNLIPSNIREKLVNVSLSSLISVTVYFEKEDINIPSNFFGFLSSDKTAHILGCFYINNMFKERCSNDNIVLLTLYMGGQTNGNDVFLKKEEIANIISNDLKLIFQISNNAKPTILKVTKWHEAIPFYASNYEMEVKNILNEMYKPKYENIFIDSGWITGTSISDRVASAKDLATLMLSEMTKRV